MAEDLEDEIFPIGMLLAGPITAIQEAQIETERMVMQFIMDYGLEEYTKKTGNKDKQGLKLRTLDFEMDRSIPDASNPGLSVSRKVNVQAPLLSVVRLPALSVDEANIDLSLDIDINYKSNNKVSKKTTSKKISSKKKNKTSLLFERRKDLPKIKGTIATRSVSRTFRSKGRMNFSIKLKSADDDEVYGRLIRFISEGMSANIDDTNK